MKSKILLLIFLLLIAEPLYGFERIETLFTRGLNYYIRREYKKAAMEWKKILDREPTHRRSKVYMEKAFTKYNVMEVNFYQGLDFFNFEEYKKAVPHFKETLMVNPRHLRALYYLELCYELLKDQINKKEASEQALKEADRLIREEEFTKAIALYKIAILLQPDNQEARIRLIEAQSKENVANQNLELMLHLQAGREYHDQKKYLEAVQEWSKALMIDPDNAEAKKMLKIDRDLLKRQQLQQRINEMISQGIELFMNREYNQAKDTFQQVLKLDSDNETAYEYLERINDILRKLKDSKLMVDEAEKHFVLGVDYFNKKQYERALDKFDFTLNIIPTHEGALEYRKRTLDVLSKLRLEEEKRKNELIQRLLMEGINLYQISEFENAIYNFKKVLKLDPDNQYASEYLRLSEEGLRLQRQSVINEDSPYYPVIKNLELKGKESINKKKYSIALHYFREIKDLFPLNKNANKYILKIRMQTEPEEVRKILDKNFARGKEYYNSKNYQRALYEFDLIKSIDPDYPEISKYWKLAKSPPSIHNKEIKIHFNKGLLYFSQKNYEKAIYEWMMTVKLDKSPLSNKYLGKALANISKAKFRINVAQGKITYARADGLSTEKTRKINKHYYMGVAYYTGGNYNKALEEFQAVLKIDSTHALAMKNIEKVQKRLKFQSE